jgi:hypothetical protein
MSSLGGQMEVEHVNSFSDAVEYGVPVVVVWGVALLIAAFVNTWPICIATAGTILTSLMMMLVPSMLYFRIGVAADYQAIPIFGIIPNRLIMFLVQLCGVLFLVGNIIKMLMLSTQSVNSIYYE